MILAMLQTALKATAVAGLIFFGAMLVVEIWKGSRRK